MRVPSKEVCDFGEVLQKNIEDLIDTLQNYRISIGLSAPQVGVQLRISVINLSKDKVEPALILINPKIVLISGNKDKKKESCMSLPHYRGEVERRDKISISYQNRFGESQNLDARGFLARVIAHEIDHLDGILYVDRMKSLHELEPVDFFK